MNYLAEILAFVNISVFGLTALTSGVHYFRIRYDQYIVLTTAAAVYLLGWIWSAADHFVSSSSIGPHPLIDLAAVFLWIFAYSWKDRPAKTRVSVIFLVFIAMSLAVNLVMSSVDGPSYIELTYGIFRLALVVYSLAYAFSNPAPGRHYFLQAFVFFLISFIVSPAAFLTPVFDIDQGMRDILRIIQNTAYAFGGISVFLFIDSLTAARGGHKRRQELIARAFEITPVITQQLKTLMDSVASERDIRAGIELVARSIIDSFGYSRIFIGRKGEDPGMEMISFPSGRHASEFSPDSFRLPETIVSEAINSRQPILIPDTSTDPRTMMDRSFELLGIRSAVVVPFRMESDVPVLMLVGDKIDGMTLDENDSALLDIISSRVSEALSSMSAAEAHEHTTETDNVTNLRNFSSFQKLLGEAVGEADKLSRTFALILFDTDHFSVINEELGYESGDRILREIGGRLTGYLGQSLAGRVGADEFAFLLPDEKEDVRAKIEGIVSGMNKNLRDLSGGKPLSISAAYSIYPYDFMEQTGVFGKMREMLSKGVTSSGRIVRVKLG